MAIFYRRTKIHELDRKHPGLKEMVEKMMDQRVALTEIAEKIGIRYGEKISSAAVQRYWAHLVKPGEERFREFVEKSKAQAKALIEEAEEDPNCDAAKMIDTFVHNQIIEDKLRLGEADIMQLLAEQRKRRQLEIERKKLRLAVEKGDRERRKLESDLDRERKKQVQVSSVVEEARAAACNGQSFDAAGVLAKISAVIGTANEPEERVEQ